MTAKEYCSRPRVLEKEMNRKLDQAERLRLLVTQTGQTFRKVSVASTRRMDRMQEAMNLILNIVLPKQNDHTVLSTRFRQRSLRH